MAGKMKTVIDTGWICRSTPDRPTAVRLLSHPRENQTPDETNNDDDKGNDGEDDGEGLPRGFTPSQESRFLKQGRHCRVNK